MIFSSLTFFIFFTVVIGLLLVLKNQRVKKAMLLAASYFFYGYWDYRFLTLIIFTSLVDFFVGKKLAESDSPKARKVILAISIFLNLGVLAFFKYFNFFVESANLAFGGFGLNLGTLNIILPVGLSFYTFQSMSYTIDVYRDKSKYCGSILDFVLFIAFFPQLVAGPIVRASDFLPQLKKDIRLKASNFRIGIQIFIFGLIKKVIIADRLAFFVDGVFRGPNLFDSSTVWLAVIAYSIQIYCDFSGYSDMAIGLARIMGFDFMTNFNFPYAATNVSDFWKRWHISLSSWLRDYLYIPLGGNRRGKTRTYINLFLTMLLGGLWHGASWNFVFWGFWHGSGLILYRIFREEFRPINIALTKATSWMFTYVFVLVGWVFFRSQSTEISVEFIKKMLFLQNYGIRWTYQSMFFILPLMVIAYIIGGKKFETRYPILDLLAFRGAFVLIFVLLGLFFLSIKDANPFIYFQF